jgi:hypothetical protein
VPGTAARSAKSLEGDGYMRLLAYVNIALAAALLGGMVLFQEIGFRIGATAPIGGVSRAGADLIEAGVFGLLGLLLAFQFARAGSRLQYRRTVTADEANAIGTAYLRLDLLTPERQPALRDLFRRYADARIRAWAKVPDLRAVKAEIAAARQLQTEIWSAAVAAVACESSLAAALLLIPALNEMFDVGTAREVAAWTHAPGLVIVFLFVVALLSAVLSGYAMSAAGHRDWLHALVFAAVVTGTVFVILDMEFPGVGLIRVGAADRAMTQARRAMD